jgi:F-type H+-transporting ATPase subunit delta
MQATKIASRYAKALLELALEQGTLEQVHNDIKYINDTCKANKSLVVFLKSPVIKTDKKIAILQEVFGGKLTKVTESYLALITNKKREKILVEIIEEFFNQYKTKKNIITAVVTTAKGIDDITRKQIVGIVKGNGNSEVVLEEKADPNIIGGIIVRVGDKQVDASVVRKLNNLKQSFKENPFHKVI